jgi:peptidoglycan/xylan/chitin deacetylase (PgdA/CDA1 family)
LLFRKEAFALLIIAMAVSFSFSSPRIVYRLPLVDKSPDIIKTKAEAPKTQMGQETPQPTLDTKQDQALIAFTFDDGYASDYYLAYPILKKYGIRGTSYIIPEYQDDKVPNTLTWQQIEEMSADGWEFGCHTYAHSQLLKLTTEEIQESMEKVNKAFEKHGMKSPELHAFPYGKYDQHAIDAMKPYRKQMRKAYYDDKIITPPITNQYQIDSISADMQGRKRLESREKLVDKACREKAIIVFRVHCMYKVKKNDMGIWPVQTDSRLFAELVDYCVAKGCRFVTMEDLLRMYPSNP